MIRHILTKPRSVRHRPAQGLTWAGQFGLVALGFSLAACAAEGDPLAPPEMHYGEDVCDACQMIISEERHAAATIVEVDGASEPRRFDDIGDLLDYHEGQPELPVLSWYVHDYETLEWLDALTASYVVSDDLATPMGHGIVAFGDRLRAEAFALEHAGEVKDFDALRADP
jgi:copper chaperone NosL